MYVCECHSIHVEVRRQLVRVGVLLPHWGSGIRTQTIRLVSKCLYPLSHPGQHPPCFHLYTHTYILSLPSNFGTPAWSHFSSLEILSLLSRPSNSSVTHTAELTGYHVLALSSFSKRFSCTFVAWGSNLIQVTKPCFYSHARCPVISEAPPTSVPHRDEHGISHSVSSITALIAIAESPKNLKSGAGSQRLHSNCSSVSEKHLGLFTELFWHILSVVLNWDE